MDRELKDLMMKLRDEQHEDLQKIQDRINEFLQKFNDHVLEDAKMLAAVEGYGKQNWHRVTEHLQSHKDARKWWLGLWGAAILGVAKAAWDMFVGKKP